MESSIEQNDTNEEMIEQNYTNEEMIEMFKKIHSLFPLHGDSLLHFYDLDINEQEYRSLIWEDVRKILYGKDDDDDDNDNDNDNDDNDNDDNDNDNDNDDNDNDNDDN